MAEMANILALVEASARIRTQCPREILWNLIRDPEDALRREICRTQLRTASENARAILAANEGMLARAKYLATIIDSVRVLACAARRPSGEALGEKEELLRLLTKIHELPAGAVEERVEFLVRLEDLKKLVLAQRDSQEGG